MRKINRRRRQERCKEIYVWNWARPKTRMRPSNIDSDLREVRGKLIMTSQNQLTWYMQLIERRKIPKRNPLYWKWISKVNECFRFGPSKEMPTYDRRWEDQNSRRDSAQRTFERSAWTCHDSCVRFACCATNYRWDPSIRRRPVKMILRENRHG